MTDSNIQFAIIDSHIHLYDELDIPRLNWTSSLPADHILLHGHTVTDWREAARSQPQIHGFVFVETDRVSDLDPENGGWDDALKEIRMVLEATQTEYPASHGGSLICAIVPWAPVAGGSQLVKQYIAGVRRVCDEIHRSGAGWSLIKGFRYLCQDKPIGTMLTDSFVDGLAVLAETGHVFDMGVDVRGRGVHQLREVAELVDRLVERGLRLRIVMNHFAKPDLRLSSTLNVGHVLEEQEGFMSGFFSELPEQTRAQPASVSTLVESIKPWVKVVLHAFGPARLMFGSDWPVCNVGGPGEVSWQHWYDVVVALLDSLGLTDEEKQEIWSGTARRAYQI